MYVHACKYICTHLCIHLRVLYNTLPLDISTTIGNCETGDVRLADSTVNTEMATREGRLEVCINNAWGSACSDQRFGVSEARVACQEAGGYTREDGEEIEPLANSGAVFLFELNCAGDETSLLECPSFPIVFMHANISCTSGCTEQRHIIHAHSMETGPYAVLTSGCFYSSGWNKALAYSSQHT